jgi:hypothetical protein
MSAGNNFELEGFLRLNSSDFQDGTDEAAESTDELAESAADSADTVETKFADKLENIGGRMRSIGTKMSVGITAPLAAVGFSSVQAASRAEEAEAKFEEVFQNTGDEVRAFADTFAEEIGRSERTIENMAANFGSMLNPMIDSDEKVAELSQNFTKLTQDLASFENMDPAKVQRDLQSALAGQSETVRKYGVDLRQARINQELMNMGIEGGTEEATRAQVAQARYNAIIADTQSAQDNAAKTSESYANQQRALRASVKDLRVEIGEQLLPIAKDLVDVITPAVDRFGELSDTQQKLIIGVAGVLAVLGPLLFILGQAAIAASALAGPAAVVAGVLSGPLLLAIGAVVGALFLLRKAYQSNFLGIQQVTDDVLGRLTGAFGSFRGAVSESIDFVLDKLVLIPTVMRAILNKIPGVSSEDILGDFDMEELKAKLFPPPPEAEAAGKETGKAAGEGVSKGVAESAPKLSDFSKVSVENVRVGNESSAAAGDPTALAGPSSSGSDASALPTAAPSTSASTTSGGFSPSDIRAALEGMALDLLGGEIELTGDNATIQDVRAELRRAGREADNRGIR